MSDINKAINVLSNFSFNKKFISKELKSNNEPDSYFNANGNMQIKGSNEIKQYLDNRKYFKEE